MPVQVATLDILIEEGRFEPEVARAIGHAIEMEIYSPHHNLATKQDLSEVRSELKAEIRELRAELKQDIAELRLELKQDIADLRKEISAAITDLSRWMFGGFMSIIMLIAGLIYFVLQHTH